MGASATVVLALGSGMAGGAGGGMGGAGGVPGGGTGIAAGTAAANVEALRVALSLQHSALAAIISRLERAGRDHVPGVDEALWQGPARIAYDIALAGVRATMRATLADARLARDATGTALATLGASVR